MNDYFDNLVAKTLGLTPAVQPRLASLFEPPGMARLPADTEPLAPPLVPEEAEILATPMPDSEFMERSKTADRREPVLPAPLAPSDELSDRKPAKVAERAAPSQSRLTLASSSEREEAGAASVSLSPREDRAAPHHPPAEIPLPPSPIIARQTLLIPASLAPTPPPPVSTGQRESRAALSDDGLLVHPTIATGVKPRADSEPADPREPDASFDGIATPSLESVAKPEPAPTIKITIGRVDVRAVMQPQPAPRPTPERRPALSLDEYLKQRSEGKP